MKFPKGQKNRDYRLETYFVGGKMKHRRIPLINGIEVEEFYLAHAEDSVLIEDGYEDLLFEREEKSEPNQPPQIRNTNHTKSEDEHLFSGNSPLS